ncbi:MAG: hypothetical protein JRI57_06960 [Deltaproteobacteria bacterium]|nr:hypothetical protein [Deltaproteobacteria bacterium]MBW1953215.1 hypothetical protein [Deltaproteobacteria bacterium]MBW1985674.1 hypothetical protein [Deltaproteobacteria bacterium]MBW2134587.1 hypothetical protein [Deltaproteobacteria bacterium]
MRRNYGSRGGWAVITILALWLAQIGWLGWRFAPEGRDLVQRLLAGQVGAAVRQQEPFFQGLTEIQEIIPASATYVFLDKYEAGKENEVRYLLYPRRHVLLPPHITPTPLFNRLIREQAAYLIVRGDMPPAAQYYLNNPSHPGFQSLLETSAGAVYRVRSQLLVRGYYD